ncbi:AraC family transcriptional regulator [Tellurirhabdus bombi]|uniref:AraC family transcriptional regulator n=1 Tax=Tellurirhabdus bombi TaxID=2907205 RepID=UPI001F44B3E2|nr:AraC family transcriptional regulator [Tellurirhabdus bombi]
MATQTLSVSSFNMILFAAQQRGANPSDLIQAVGVKPEQLGDPDGRIPIPTVQALWHEAITATGDPALALHMSEMINPAAIGVLAYVMMHCPTLEKALDKLCQYQDIVCEGVVTKMQKSGDQFSMVLQIISPDIIYLDHVLNSELSIYLAAMRALTNQPVAAKEISFAYPRPLDSREHERIFAPARLTFDAPETKMIMDASWLDTPILNAHPGLFPLFEQRAENLLSQLRTSNGTTLKVRVKEEIIELLKGEEPTLAAVADRLSMGLRTLQLHLKEEGVTYQQLLDEVRRDLAEQHLRDSHLSTTDIAYLLGYSEPSVFYRSFKKWTGSTPGDYRSSRLTFRQSA